MIVKNGRQGKNHIRMHFRDPISQKDRHCFFEPTEWRTGVPFGECVHPTSFLTIAENPTTANPLRFSFSTLTESISPRISKACTSRLHIVNVSLGNVFLEGGMSVRADILRPLTRGTRES